MHPRRVAATIPERGIRDPGNGEWNMDDRAEEPVAIGAWVAANRYPWMKQHLANCENLGVAGADIRAAAEVGTDIEEEKRREEEKHRREK
jgi:hypothetical protein